MLLLHYTDFGATVEARTRTFALARRGSTIDLQSLFGAPAVIRTQRGSFPPPLQHRILCLIKATTLGLLVRGWRATGLPLAY